MSSFSADALHDEVVEVTHNLCEAFSEHEESGGQKIPQITQMLEQVSCRWQDLRAHKLHSLLAPPAVSLVLLLSKAMFVQCR